MNFRLLKKHGKVYIQFEKQQEKLAKILWARPLTGRWKEISIVDEKKKEIIFLDSLNSIPTESRQIAKDELIRNYFLPKIIKVFETKSHRSCRYWHVETEKGPRKFLMKNPNRDFLCISQDNIILRDHIGNCYEIVSFRKLDRSSKNAINKII
ncbi:DUF1854 domain-containing protein [Candidatus Uabimicrobium amorphum]|uniref:DUF1854 domain-containing protein n=1 Tax=Uabimicrobium amorphum TaxID=2596890 RepID=A0A5S9F5P7_UABAM|nr:DUF1854 domain-containing protein [Candidatus Uabimicrobium amorphum]BBM87066.1 hypothetical protein UABAM_05469 [Candidatus Uabimicrobium amorphum]